MNKNDKQIDEQNWQTKYCNTIYCLWGRVEDELEDVAYVSIMMLT